MDSTQISQISQMSLNTITYQIRGAIFDVYNHFGPGLLENIYEKALMIELADMGLHAINQEPIEVKYKNHDLGLAYKIDVLVENMVIIELKSVECLLPCHYKQLQTYLNLSGLGVGFLVNFNTDDIIGNLKRVVSKHYQDIEDHERSG
ncbi:MAG: GxxExxY protein [Candidatus Cloacimonadaceae bacterium]|nr:GxxExxY protein [Candidatus Cloacimonadaceae bacterium]